MPSEQIISGVAQRYARSVFELAQEQDVTEAVEKDLGVLEQALKDSAEFRLFVTSPALTAQEQIDGLYALLPKFDIKSLAANFALLLAKNRRLTLLAETIIAFRQIRARSKGETNAEVTSAEPLSETQTQALKDALKTATGKDVALESHVDQSLIGGLIVKLGSRMIDTSLKSKLSNLKIALKGIS